jgi:small subunit ribosomal protein S5
LKIQRRKYKVSKMADKKEEKKEEPKEAEASPDDEEEVSLEVEKEVIEVPEEEEAEKEVPKVTFDVAGWSPKTAVGKAVKAGSITDIDEVLDKGIKILESPVIDILMPGAESDLLLVGQSKGKFGGGQRRVFKQTQKKTREGNKPKFSTFAVVGNGDGYVGIGYGKSKETVPSREKAIRNAKLGLFKIRRGCGSWQCGCRTAHSIPFKVTGKCGSVEITLMPAPRGKGLCVEAECAKILKFAGINDVWSKTKGQTGSKGNLIKACIKALKQLTTLKVSPKQIDGLGIVDGKLKKEENQNE